VIDPFEEARGLEMNERLATRERGRFTVADLIAAAANHRSIGWDDAGEIAVGKRADLAVLDAPSHVHLAYRPGVPLVVDVSV